MRSVQVCGVFCSCNWLVICIWALVCICLSLSTQFDLVHRKAILELMQAIDDYIPDPTRALDRPFSLPVEDVFSIQGRGTVVTGRIEQGIVKVGEEIEIIGIQPATKTIVTGTSSTNYFCQRAAL